jgi:hypothetical protein
LAFAGGFIDTKESTFTHPKGCLCMRSSLAELSMFGFLPGQPWGMTGGSQRTAYGLMAPPEPFFTEKLRLT